jgi:hypothetical protein
MNNTNPANPDPARPLPERAHLEHLKKRRSNGSKPLDLARAEIGAVAQEYFPPAPRGPKIPEPTIALLNLSR